MTFSLLVQSFGLRVSGLQALCLNPYQKLWEELIMGLPTNQMEVYRVPWLGAGCMQGSRGRVLESHPVPEGPAWCGWLIVLQSWLCRKAAVAGH